MRYALNVRRWLLVGYCAALGVGGGVPVRADNDIGILILAQRGPSNWRHKIKRAVKEARLPFPTRIFFGAGSSQKQVDQLQGHVRALESKGVYSIVAIPIALNSSHEAYRQWRYLLGAGVKPGFINNPFFPVDHKAEIRVTEPFNDDPVVAEMLLMRAKSVSQNPSEESVILVAHGPNDDSDNQRALTILDNLGLLIRKQSSFRSVIGLTLRDDAPSEIRNQAIQTLRETVENLNRQQIRAVVLPLSLAPGGAMESRIRQALKGLDYTVNAKALVEDSRVPQWIRDKAVR